MIFLNNNEQKCKQNDMICGKILILQAFVLRFNIKDYRTLLLQYARLLVAIFIHINKVLTLEKVK